MLQVKVLKSMSDVKRAEWDMLVGDGSPFMEWDWLACMEEARCIAPKTGWQPQHLTVYDDGQLVAGCPLYLKSHSMGEFVFDHAWADAAQRAGIEYYPKMLVAAPFTPATGVRFLTAPGSDRPELIRLLGQALQSVCKQNELSSVHINFCLPDEAEVLAEIGYLKRVGIQYQWLNHGYHTFDDYLAHFRTKRRNQIKREMREMNDQGVEIDVLSGEAIPTELFPHMFSLYKTHLDRLYWGRQYLKPKFFDLLGKRFKRNLCFVVARHGGRLLRERLTSRKTACSMGAIGERLKTCGICTLMSVIMPRSTIVLRISLSVSSQEPEAISSGCVGLIHNQLSVCISCRASLAKAVARFLDNERTRSIAQLTGCKRKAN